MGERAKFIPLIALAALSSHEPVNPAEMVFSVDDTESSETPEERERKRLFFDTAVGAEFERQIESLPPVERERQKKRWEEIILEIADKKIRQKFRITEKTGRGAQLYKKIDNKIHTPEFAEVAQAVRKTLEKFGDTAGAIHRDTIHAISLQESDFNPNEITGKTLGVMQLMPGDKATEGYRREDYFDIEKNVEGGVRELVNKQHSLGGNIAYALQAYNEGEYKFRDQLDSLRKRKKSNVITVVDLYNDLHRPEKEKTAGYKSIEYVFGATFYEHYFRMHQSTVDAVLKGDTSGMKQPSKKTRRRSEPSSALAQNTFTIPRKTGSRGK